MQCKHSRRTFAATLAAGATAIWLAGCAATSAPSGSAAASADSEAALLARAKAYWAAMKVNDQVTAWNYEAVSTEAGMTLQAYLQQGGPQYEDVQVVKVLELEGGKAKVQLDMSLNVPLMRIKGLKMQPQDEWQFLNGQWYHVLSKGALFK